MDAKDLLREMGEIDDEYVEEAAEAGRGAETAERSAVSAGSADAEAKDRKRKIFFIKPWMIGGIAAAAALVFVGIGLVRNLSKVETAESTAATAEAALAEEAAEDAGAAETADYAEEVSEDTGPADAADYAEEAAETEEAMPEEAEAESVSGSGGKEEAVSLPQTANPFEEYAAAGEAEKAAGFAFSVPSKAAGAEPEVYRVIPGKLYEVLYTDEGTEILRVRKAPGSADISGDYTVYLHEITARVGDRQVTLRGDGETAADMRVSVATWTDQGYSYALEMQDYPLEKSEVLAIIAEIDAV